VSGTRSPSADRIGPRTFQGRLTLAFVAVVAVTLGLVGLLVVNRLGAYFDQQQADDLQSRAHSVAQYVILVAESASTVRAGRPVVSADGVVDELVAFELSKEIHKRLIADTLAQADVRIRLGLALGPDLSRFEPATNGDVERNARNAPASLAAIAFVTLPAIDVSRARSSGSVNTVSSANGVYGPCR